ncbi:hypothetical protein QN277_015057 [Acacia crassicarpa]|nr:hypothetical protein QN277_015057 [Acacia crassicarpa]
MASNLWNELKRGCFEPEFLNLQGLEWFKWNLKCTPQNWRLIFGIACWSLWNWRNKCIFEVEFQMPDSCSQCVLRYAKEVITARQKLGVQGVKQEVLVRWMPPLVGTFKLNVDGCSKGMGKLAGCGGLIRTDDGQWVTGFAKKLGACSAFKAELWAVLTSLKLAAELKLSNLIVEADSYTVIQLLQNLQDGIVNTDATRLLTEIGHVMPRFSRLLFAHVFREGNASADALANLAVLQEIPSAVFDRPPECLHSFLCRDVMGVALPRSILIQ